MDERKIQEIKAEAARQAAILATVGARLRLLGVVGGQQFPAAPANDMWESPMRD